MRKYHWLIVSVLAIVLLVAVPVGVLWNGAMSFGLYVDHRYPIGMCADGTEAITGDFLFPLAWIVPLLMFPVAIWSGARAFRSIRRLFFVSAIVLSVVSGSLVGILSGTVAAIGVFLPLEMRRVCECKNDQLHMDGPRGRACDFVRARENT